MFFCGLVLKYQLSLSFFISVLKLPVNLFRPVCMKRRIALKNMALAVGSLVFLPACDPILKRTTSQSYLNPQQDELLAGIVDTFIPATDTAGAKDLDVHLFVRKMIQDCYEEEVMKIFTNGLDKVEQLAVKEKGESFIRTSEPGRIGLLEKMEHSEREEDQEFFSLVKELTILGYTTSQYVLTKLTGYEMVPGHYYGCTDVQSKPAV